jgi:hypothetical protein
LLDSLFSFCIKININSYPCGASPGCNNLKKNRIDGVYFSLISKKKIDRAKHTVTAAEA